ncbi:MAG TPA: hypothetical protein GXZ45_08455 [Propionibacterium sp.]|nr:hypothetical protein [Propionibacterium sp.]
MATPYQTPYQQAPRRGNLPLGILLGVIVGAIVVALAWFAFVGDPDSATPAPTPSQTQPIESPTPDESPSPEPSPDAESPSPTPTETADESPTPTPEPSETESAPPEGIVTELPTGTWVTVLDSLPQGSVSAEQAVARAEQLAKPGHEVIVIDTNRFEGLNRNYWAVVIPGAESRAASNDVCRDIGMAVGDTCYPREVKGPR